MSDDTTQAFAAKVREALETAVREDPHSMLGPCFDSPDFYAFAEVAARVFEEHVAPPTGWQWTLVPTTEDWPA